MMAAKTGRMWLMPTRSTLRVHGRNRARGRIIHLVLLGASVLGLVAGLWRRRHPALLLVAVIVVYSTLLNAVLVAEARHNLPLLPALYAAGAAGWAIALSRRPAPATELDRLSASPR
jgi:CHASE2 domain-containing sensor protein